MLLAPMIFEDQVLGVLVLSKLGLHQFSDDDLRLLVIYASFAAQAFANADATDRLRAQSEALERQLANQRGLLQVTESILTTLDPRAILDQVADRLVRPRRLRQHRDRDRRPADRTPPAADRPRHPRRRVHGAVGARRGGPRDVGRRPQRAGPRPRRAERSAGQPLPATDAMDGSLICVPLRGRDGATGVLTLERLGARARATPRTSSSSSSCSPRRSRSPSRTPRSTARSRSGPRPTT